MRLINKNPKADLRNYYFLFFETGLIFVLAGFITLTNIELNPGEESRFISSNEKEIIMTTEITRTMQQKKPPPPPPQVPVEVPNDEVIDEVAISFNSELDFDEPLALPEMPERVPFKEDEEEEDFFVAVEQMPELIGGMEKLYSEIRYPKSALGARIEGLVVVQFIVTKDGTIKDPVVVRGIGGGCDEEAVRVIKQSTFIPGRQRGVAVPVRYSIGIRFIYRER